MGVFGYVILGLLQLLVNFLDLLVLLLLVRLAFRHWKPAWLGAIDAAGQPILDGTMQAVDRAVVRTVGKPLHAGIRPFVCLAITAVLRELIVNVLYR